MSQGSYKLENYAGKRFNKHHFRSILAIPYFHLFFRCFLFFLTLFGIFGIKLHVGATLLRLLNLPEHYKQLLPTQLSHSSRSAFTVGLPTRLIGEHEFFTYYYWFFIFYFNFFLLLFLLFFYCLSQQCTKYLFSVIICTFTSAFTQLHTSAEAKRNDPSRHRRRHTPLQVAGK